MAKRKRTTIDRDAQRERQRKLEELIERGWAELRAQQAAKPARHDTRPT
jgi:hypothetical protein